MLELMLDPLFLGYVFTVVVAFITRLRIHLRHEDLSIVDFTKYLMIAVIPIANVIVVGNAVYDEYYCSWDKFILISRSGSDSSLLGWFDRFQTDIVMFGAEYAVRKTRTRFGIFKKMTYLNFTYNGPAWCKKTESEFTSCLTSSLAMATERMSRHGFDIGIPITGGTITFADFVPMMELARHDVGMKDLLTTAKEWYVLKTKGNVNAV